MSRYVHVCTSHGVGLPALRKAASAEIFANAAEAQLAKGRIRPVTTNVSRYVSRKSPALARALQRILVAKRKSVAAKVKALFVDKLAKDTGHPIRLIASLIENLESEDLGLDLEDELAPAMLAAFRRAAAIGATQVGFSVDGITAQVDVAAVAYAARRGGELIKDLAGTTRDAMQGLLSRAVEEGMSADELSTAVEGLGAFSDYRADVIARTELAYAHVQGNVEGWRAAGDMVVGKRSILGDLHEIADECDDAAEAGVVPMDEEFGPGLDFPPYHPQCCLPGTVVAPAGRIAAEFSRPFQGEVVSIRTARNHLCVTPNHPILTLGGWVAAGKLQLGDLVVEAADPGAASRLVEPHDQNVPARIEEVARALLVAGGMATRRMPATAEAFHGDGVPDGKVDVVWAAGAFSLGLESAELKRRTHATLGASDRARNAFARQGNARTLGDADLPASHGRVRSLGHFEPSLGRALGAGEQLHFGETAHLQSTSLEDVAQGRAVTAQFGGQLDAGLARHVAGMDGCDTAVIETTADGIDVSGTAQSDTQATEQALNHLVRDGQLCGKRADRLTGLVSTAQVVELTRGQYEGTVHNIMTGNGWYFAEGIIVHNCVCDVVPVLREEND